METIIANPAPVLQKVLESAAPAKALVAWRARGTACTCIDESDDPETLLAVASSVGVPVDVALDVVARSILTHPLFLDLVFAENPASTSVPSVREVSYAAAFAETSGGAAPASIAAILEHCVTLPDDLDRSVMVAVGILSCARASCAHAEQALFLAHRAVAVIPVGATRRARAAHRLWNTALCSCLRAAIAGWREFSDRARA